MLKLTGLFPPLSNHKRPVYIELPRDMIHVSGTIPIRTEKTISLSSDKMTLDQALDKTVELINQAKQPVILAGIELQRFGLQESALAIAHRYQIPMVATILGKSVIAESDPLYLGIYAGAMSNKRIRNYVDDSDCLLNFGAMLTDINMGIFTHSFNENKMVSVHEDHVHIQKQQYNNIKMADFLNRLINKPIKSATGDQKHLIICNAGNSICA